jgi:branched-chain amino acid transport system substrate-binding protein
MNAGMAISVRLTAVALVCAVCFGTTAWAQDKTIKIAALIPLSGPASYFGVQDKRGFALGLEEAAKAGLGGYKIDLHYEDSACAPLPATEAVKRVIDEYHPDLVLGEECSDASLAIMPTLEAAKIPLLNAGSTADQLTDSGYHYVFRIFPTATQQGTSLAQHAFNDLKARTAVMLYEKTNAGIDNAQRFAKPFEKLGGKVLASIDYGRDVNDFTAIATRVAGLGAIDVIPSFGLEGQAVKLTQALGQAGVVKGSGGKAIQIGAIWLPEGFDQKAGKAAIGYIRIVQFDPNDPRPVVRHFVAAFKAKYGADAVPTHIDAHSYDQILLAADAIRQGAHDAKSFRDIFSRMKGVQVTTGTIDFGPNGQNTNLSVMHYVETTPQLTWHHLDWK